MRAAAEVRGRAVGERGVGGLERRPDRAPAALDELGRPRQPERALLVARERAALGALDPVGRVRAQELLARGRARVVHLEARVRRDASAQQRVLAEREAVPVRQRIGEAVVGVAAQRGCFSARQGLAAVGDEPMAGHVRGVVREQEARQPPRLLGAADAPERHEPRHLGEKALAPAEVLPRGRVERRVDPARAERVDADSLAAVVARDLTRERERRGLRDGIRERSSARRAARSWMR